VHRQELLKRLEEDPRRAAILVSAPAGYGKSTLVSHWTESLQDPFAWLSLDAEDSDLETFLRYLDKNISKQRVVNTTRIDKQRVVL
jgi:LuxR family maltose regulon positive regulatory protein